MTFFDRGLCGECGCGLSEQDHSGKTKTYRNVEVVYPPGSVIPTCDACGAVWMNPEQLERVYRSFDEQVTTLAVEHERAALVPGTGFSRVQLAAFSAFLRRKASGSALEPIQEALRALLLANAQCRGTHERLHQLILQTHALGTDFVGGEDE